jgi:hypothetical protein
MSVMVVRVLVTERVSHPFRDLRDSLADALRPLLGGQLALALGDDDSSEPSDALERDVAVEADRRENGVRKIRRGSRLARVQQIREWERKPWSRSDDRNGRAIAQRFDVERIGLRECLLP